MIRQLRAVVVTSSLLAVGCDMAPGEVLEIGQVCCAHSELQLSLPDTVDAGLPFEVMVKTFGNS